MYCNQCRLEIPDNYKFCPKCGAGVETKIDELKKKLSSGEISDTEYDELRKKLEKVQNKLCDKCGNALSSAGFCIRCRSNNDHAEHQSNSHKSQNSINRGTYQKLALIGGIFGIVITPIIAFSLGLMLAIGSAFSSTALTPEQSANLTMTSTSVSIIVSIIGIIIAYLIKKPRNVGVVLILLGIIEMIGTAVVLGIITWVLFIVSGIIAIRQKDFHTSTKFQAGYSNDNATDILIQRYAKGEITKEEFDQMKGVLDG